MSAFAPPPPTRSTIRPPSAPRPVVDTRAAVVQQTNGLPAMPSTAAAVLNQVYGSPAPLTSGAVWGSGTPAPYGPLATNVNQVFNPNPPPAVNFHSVPTATDNAVAAANSILMLAPAVSSFTPGIAASGANAGGGSTGGDTSGSAYVPAASGAVAGGSGDTTAAAPDSSLGISLPLLLLVAILIWSVA